MPKETASQGPTLQESMQFIVQALGKHFVGNETDHAMKNAAIKTVGAACGFNIQTVAEARAAAKKAPVKKTPARKSPPRKAQPSRRKKK